MHHGATCVHCAAVSIRIVYWVWATLFCKRGGMRSGLGASVVVVEATREGPCRGITYLAPLALALAFMEGERIGGELCHCLDFLVRTVD